MNSGDGYSGISWGGKNNEGFVEHLGITLEPSAAINGGGGFFGDPAGIGAGGVLFNSGRIPDTPEIENIRARSFEKGGKGG